MMSQKEFIESQKECAEMLGMSLKEYEKYCKNIKVSRKEKSGSKNSDDKVISKILKEDRSA